MSVCKSVFVHAHVQTKRLIASKFGTEILERVFEKSSKQFFKNRSKIFRMIFKSISWILMQPFLLFHDCIVINARFLKFASPKILYRDILKRDFERTLKRFFSKIAPDYLQGIIKLWNICLG